MEVTVDVGNKLPGDHPSLDAAANWLRKQLGIAGCFREDFEQHFDCRIITDDRRDSWMQPNWVVFENSAAVTLFLLRWS